LHRGGQPDPGRRGSGQRARAAALVVGSEPPRLKRKECPMNNLSRIAWPMLALSAVLPACKRVQGAQVPPQRPPAPVSVATALEQDVPVYLDQIGKNVAPEVVTIQPQVSGDRKSVV